MSLGLIPLAILMWAVTFPARAMPMMAPGIDRLPPVAVAYLRLAGPATLAALAAMNCLVTDATPPSLVVGIEPVAVIFCALIVAKTRLLLPGVVAAVLLVAVARALGAGWPRAASLRRAPRHGPLATRHSRRAGPPDAILAHMPIDRRPPEPAHLGRARGAVAYSFLVHGVMFGAWASRIPAIKDQTGLDSTHLGFALLAASAGAVLAMSFAGVLAGRFGSNVVTVAMLLGYAVVVPGLALANSFVTLTVALLLVGAFQGSMDVAMNSNGLAVEQAGTRPIISRLHGTWSIGSFLGATVTIVAVTLGLSVLAQFCLLAVWMAVSALVMGRTMLPHRQPAGGSALRRPPRRLLALGFLIFCGMLAEGSAGDWSGVYMRTSVLSTEQQAALTLGAFSVAMAVSRLVGDRMTELLGAGRLVTLGAVLGAAGLGMALLLNLAVPAIVGFTMLGLGLGAIVPICLRAGGSQPGIPSGFGIAAVSTMGYAGLLTGPPIIGTVAGAVGLRAALAMVVGLLVVLALTAGRAVGAPPTIPEPAVPTELL